MNYEEGDGQQEAKHPGHRPDIQQAVCEKKQPADADEQGLVDTGPSDAEFHRDGDPGRRVALHVPDVVDIEHCDAPAADCCGREQPERGETVCADICRTGDGDQAEEDENGYVSLRIVAVGVLSKGVAHRSPDCCGSKYDKQERFGGEQGAETEMDHGQAADAAEQGCRGNQPLHLWDAYFSVLK